MNMLGNSVYQIAHEKAGIIKQGVPVVIGEYQASCDSAFIDRAKRCSSAIHFASIKSEYISNESESIMGPFRTTNLRTADYALKYLNSNNIIELSEESITTGLNQFAQLTGYIGRWQVLQESPTTIADSAHNVDAISQVVTRLRTIQYRELKMVLGFVKEKDLSGILSLLPKEAIYYLVRPEIFRAMDLDSLGSLFDEYGLRYELVGAVHEGYELARSRATDDDLVYVGGSSFVVGDLLTYLDGLSER